MSEAETYSARQLKDGPQAGKWAVFRGDEQATRGGGEGAARSWANLMNRIQETSCGE